MKKLLIIFFFFSTIQTFASRNGFELGFSGGAVRYDHGLKGEQGAFRIGGAGKDTFVIEAFIFGGTAGANLKMDNCAAADKMCYNHVWDAGMMLNIRFHPFGLPLYVRGAGGMGFLEAKVNNYVYNGEAETLFFRGLTIPTQAAAGLEFTFGILGLGAEVGYQREFPSGSAYIGGNGIDKSNFPFHGDYISKFGQVMLTFYFGGKK